MRVRKVISRSGKHIRVKFPSAKSKKMIHCESTLERDAAYHFEYHPEVVNYQEQPSIEYYYDRGGVQHRYFPDFRVDFKNGSELFIEIKPASKLGTQKIREKLEAVAKRFKEKGQLFRVMTELEIRREPLFSNLKRLHGSSKHSSQVVPNDAMAATLPEGKFWSFGVLCQLMNGSNNVLRLVHSNHLQIDLESPLSCDAKVWLTSSMGSTENGSFFI